MQVENLKPIDPVDLVHDIRKWKLEEVDMNPPEDPGIDTPEFDDTPVGFTVSIVAWSLVTALGAAIYFAFHFWVAR